MTAILRRELNSYFASPIAYVYLGLFTAFTGMIYFITVYSGLSSSTYIFAYSFYFSMYLVPVLTMRLLTEERKQRTDQLLLTAPIRLFDIVAGKFLAAFAVYCAGMCSTVLEVFVLSFFCDFNWAVFWSSFIGIILLGGASIAICMFVSSMTENQIIAAVVGFVVMLILSVLDAFSSLFSNPVLQEVMLKLSFYVRYFDLTLGVLDFSDIFFFLSVTGVFLFLTTRVIDRRRWS